MTKKGRQFFSGKNGVAAPDDTNPSDATAYISYCVIYVFYCFIVFSAVLSLGQL